MPARRWVIAAVALGVAALAIAASTADVAYVLTVSGPWKLARTGRLVHAGQVLRARDSLSLQRKPDKSEVLTILGCDNRIVAQRRCALDDCSADVVIPVDVDKEKSLFARLIQSVMSRWFSAGEQKFASMSTRDNRFLFEGVVPVGSDAAVDLHRIVGALPQGNYKLVWQPVPDTRPAGAKFENTIHIVDRQPVTANLFGLKAGLYDVEATDIERGGPPVESWVLATDRDSYASVSATFDEAVEAANAWALSVSSGDTVRRFLRAALYDMVAPKRESE
jgi:hypothetical protein